MKDMGVPATPSGHSGSAPSPDGLGHSASVPNAYQLARLLRALASDCDSTDGWEGASNDLRASAELLEQLAVTVRHVYATKLPDTWFVCGASTEADANGLPDRIHICPAYGVGWSEIYQRMEASNG